jgi:hypothetical protein
MVRAWFSGLAGTKIPANSMFFRRLRADRALLAAFGYARPFVSWAFLLTGLAGTVGTFAGQLPPISGSWWARITTGVLWLVLADQGYEQLADQGDEVLAEDVPGDRGVASGVERDHDGV